MYMYDNRKYDVEVGGTWHSVVVCALWLLTGVSRSYILILLILHIVYMLVF